MELNTKVKAPGNIMSARLDGEAVLMDAEKGVYYGLNEVGAFIWDLMAEPVLIRDLCRAVAEGFEVDPGVCGPDILALLKELGDEGLVEILGEEM